jgi:hypothetical protein
MPRRRRNLGALRGCLYALARGLGDLQAVLKGPQAMLKRLARRAAGRATARVLWRWFK